MYRYLKSRLPRNFAMNILAEINIFLLNKEALNIYNQPKDNGIHFEDGLRQT